MKTTRVLCILCLLAGPAAQAATFKCVENGRTVYSDRQCAPDAVRMGRATPTAAHPGKLPREAAPPAPTIPTRR